MFGIAIITYGFRTYCRARMIKGFFADDVMLLCAIICLVAETGAVFASLQDDYDTTTVVLNGGDPALVIKVLGSAVLTSRLQNTAWTLCWFVLFGVKLSFLFFFRRLVHRVRDLRIWCYAVIIFTTLSGLASLVCSWLTCPYFTMEAILSKWQRLS